jgi:predicted nucleic acid-binding protein
VVPAPIPAGLLRDLDDEPILATAIAGQADVLCTRDLHFSDDKVHAFAAEHGIRIMTELELLALLDEQGPTQP